jgi:hypothetical protein
MEKEQEINVAKKKIENKRMEYTEIYRTAVNKIF